MNFIYPCIVHKEDDGYWSEFPDIDGCFSDGDTLNEIIEHSKEALQGVLLAYMDLNKEIPKPTEITELQVSEEDFTTYIDCSILNKTKLVKKTLTIPEWVNVIGVEKDVNFSKLLTEAIINY